MKVRLLFMGMLLSLLVSCAAEKQQRLPEFVPEAPHSVIPEQKRSCELIYPEGKWLFTHSIEFTLAGGAGNTLLGVTVLDGNEIDCALMTIEGLTLFEAQFTDRLEVVRAIPPFDNPAFAAGLMDDVRAIFTRLPGNIQYGSLGENAAWCRITAEDGRVTDVMPSDNEGWRINTYSTELIRTRTIIARSSRTVASSLIPEKLELTVPGPTGYTLKMNLISAEKIAPETTDNPKNLRQ